MKNILKTMTRAQLDEYLQDEAMKAMVGEQLLRVCRGYANMNKINGIEYEDYIYDLFLTVWSKLDMFDEKKGQFTTFAYQWFRSYKSKYFGSNVNKLNTVSLDEETTQDGSMTRLDSIEDESIEDFLKSPEYDLIYELAGPELRYWSEGLSQGEIAKKVHLTQAQVSRRLAQDIRRIKRLMGIKD